MKRWDDVLKEEPSKALRESTETRVFAEMAQARGSRRWWLQLAGISVAVVALFSGFALLRFGRSADESSEEQILLELAEEDTLDLENLEDLEVIELLEELEQWQNG